MSVSFLFVLSATVLLLAASVAGSAVDPEQIHLSLGQHQDDWWVSFVTFAAPPVAFVLYGTDPSSLSSSVNASSSLFVDEGSARKQRFMHEAAMPHLTAGTVYYYQLVTTAVSPSSLPMYNFSTIAASAGFSQPLRIAMYGDYGLLNDRSHDRLLAESQAGNLDLIIHAGDMAYNLNDEDGDRGDQFMNAQQSFLSHTPMQVCPGNHEDGYNFSHYIHRFHMPGHESGSGTNLYSSFNVGPVHFVSISTELYFYSNYYNDSHILRQYQWLEADLKQAVSQRRLRPWIVVYGHRPQYCTDDTDDDPTICTLDTSALRDGVSFPHGGHRVGALEPLLWKYAVDLYFSGHMHSYERLFPTYRGQVLGHGYDPLIAPLHIIAGAAGCQEELDEFDYLRYPWSAVTSDSYGYGKLIVHNASHAEWQQILDEDGSVLDHIWMVRRPQGFTIPDRTQAAKEDVEPVLVRGRRHSKK